MDRYWADIDLERITPPQVKDVRGRGLIRTLDRAFASQPVANLSARNPETCPAEALPALIAEYSMEEFIEPGLPENVIRKILKNAWVLQSSEGYDDGVKRGLSLLGMSMQIEHWWQVEPKRPANTHRLYFFVGESLFPDQLSVLNARSTKAALRMIKATKRWSQESEIFVGARLAVPATRTALQGTALSCRRARMRMIQQTPRIRVQSDTTAIRRDIASVTRAKMTVTNQTPGIRITYSSAAMASAIPTTSRRLTLKGGL